MTLLFCYKIVTIVIYLLVLPFGKMKAGQGDVLWKGRLGDIEPSDDKTLWMHAASVGEVRVIGHLIDYLRKKRTDLPIHLTVVTRTGYDTAIKLYGDTIRVTIFPLDAPVPVARTVRNVNPRMVIITETEIWFNLLRRLFELDIPVILVNGRMSDKGFNRYRMIGTAMRRLIPRYERLFLKTESDLDRYRYFGATEEKSFVAGDMKFDAPLVERSAGRIKEIRSRLGISDDDFLFVAGSTRPGEEVMMLKLLKKLSRQSKQLKLPKQLKLLLAPRHINRADEIRELLNQNEISFTTYGSVNPAKDAILVDRMGILNELYLAADLSFVGGTLVNRGGHNLLEPVWAGTPVLFGPSIGNVEDAAEYVEANNYGRMVATEDELARVVHDVMCGKETFATKTESASALSATAHIGDYVLERLTDA